MTDKVVPAVEILVESGLLFEINRRVLHPLGLALACVETDAGGYNLSPKLWDARYKAEGIVFTNEALLHGFRKLGAYMRERGFSDLARRYETLGCRVQTVEEAHPFADEAEWRLPSDVHPIEEVPEFEDPNDALIRALGGPEAATRTRNRQSFLIERGIKTRDHLLVTAAKKVAEDIARLGRWLEAVFEAIDEVDAALAGEFDVGVRARIDRVLKDSQFE